MTTKCAQLTQMSISYRRLRKPHPLLGEPRAEIQRRRRPADWRSRNRDRLLLRLARQPQREDERRIGRHSRVRMGVAGSRYADGRDFRAHLCQSGRGRGTVPAAAGD